MPRAVAAREPSDVARCYELPFSADGALTLQDDDDRVVVGGEILANRGAGSRSPAGGVCPFPLADRRLPRSA
jgi:hypothetical protein